jgi:predicted Fe-S protein YdhL (DUF1289 family)
MSEPESPCCGQCKLDNLRQYCLGCARHIDEIVGWRGMTAAEKQAVIAALPARQKA